MNTPNSWKLFPLFASSLFFIPSACTLPESQNTTPPPQNTTPTTQNSKTQTLHIQALLTESLHQRPLDALHMHQKLSKNTHASPRLRALSLYHSIRLLTQAQRPKEALALHTQLQQQFPQQKDLLKRSAQLTHHTPKLQHPITLQLRKVNVHTALKMLSQSMDLNLKWLTTPPSLKLDIQLRKTPRWEALQTIAWTMGYQLQRQKQTLLISPSNTIKIDRYIDTFEDEIPRILQLISTLAQKNDISLTLRHISVDLQKEGLNIYPTQATMKGSPNAIATFLGHLRLLPFQIQTHIQRKRIISPGNTEVRAFLGLLFVKSQKPLTQLAQTHTNTPQTQPNNPLPKMLSHLNIRQVFRANQNGVKNCFETHIKQISQNNMRIILNLTLQHQGHISKANIEKAPQDLPQGFTQCLLDWAKQRKFPPFRSGQITIRYPFRFSK